MKRGWFLMLAVFGILFFVTNESMAYNLKLPLEGGKTYQVTVGYDGSTYDGSFDKYHTGNASFALDFDNPIGDENITIVAAIPGVVEKIYDNPNTGYGYGVRLKHEDGSRTVYGHFKSLPIVEEGSYVLQGQALGKMGTTGWSSGTHLHFELRGSDGKTIKPEPMSGYIDFTPGEYYTSNNYLNHTVIKPSDSHKVYLISNNQLWHIKDEETYALLGFHLPEQCNTPDWSHIQEVDASWNSWEVWDGSYEDGKLYMRSEILPSISDPYYNPITYRVVEKVGPESCMSSMIDSNKIFILGEDMRFHWVETWDDYVALGYGDSDRNIVDITPELFAEYGSGEPVTAGSVYGAGYHDDDNTGGVGGYIYTPEVESLSSSPGHKVFGQWNCGDNPPNYGNWNFEVYINDTYIETTSLTSKLYAIDPDIEQVCLKVRIVLEDEYSEFSEAKCVILPEEAEENDASGAVESVGAVSQITTFRYQGDSPETTDEFFVEQDDFAHFCISLSGINSSFRFYWRIYAPDGKIKQQSGFDYQFNNNDSLTTDDTFALANVNEKYGEWRIEVWIDNVKRQEKYFTINPAPESNDSNQSNDSDDAGNCSDSTDSDDCVYYGNFNTGFDGFELENYFSSEDVVFRLDPLGGPDGNQCLLIDSPLADEFWHIEAKKVGLNIQEGKKYQVSFWAKAETPGLMPVAILHDVSPWETYGLWHSFDIDTEWAEYSIEFIAENNPVPEESRIGFELGAQSGKMWIDDILVTNVVESSTTTTSTSTTSTTSTTSSTTTSTTSTTTTTMTAPSTTSTTTTSSTTTTTTPIPSTTTSTTTLPSFSSTHSHTPPPEPTGGSSSSVSGVGKSEPGESGKGCFISTINL